MSSILPDQPGSGDARPQGPLGPAPAAQGVYEALRAQILAMELAPDTTLSRSALAERFGVSQTPLREALQQLELDGLVRIVPQSRTVVTRIDVRALAETHFLRVAVETEVVRRLAQSPPRDTLGRARALVRMQGSLVGDSAQTSMFFDLDRALHRTLFEGIGMAAIYALVARRQGHLARCQRIELPMQGKMEAILAHHDAILDAIEAGDPDAAAAAMREHLSGTMRRLADLRLAHPDYFTGGSL